MAEGVVRELQAGFQNLERQVSSLSSRVAVLEKAVRADQPQEEVQVPAFEIRDTQPTESPRPQEHVTPPPIQVRPAAPPVTGSEPPAPEPPLAARIGIQEREEPEGDAEYRIGGVILPRIGAGVVLVAIGTFVSMAIGRGWIGPVTQFWMAVSACLGFVGVGFWKRNEGEEFGQVLVGIGSCGLYLTFAAGHVFLHLYEGEALVVQFLVLSFANLAHSQWSSSRSFLAIGVIGGLAAAVMPMRESNLTLNALLHFAIVIPATLIVMRNRWTAGAIVLALASAAALVPAMLLEQQWLLRVGMLYGTALLCVAAYGRASDSEVDKHCLFAPIALVASAVLALAWVQPGMEGVAHTAVFGVASLAVALAFGVRETVGKAVAAGGAAVLLAVAPWGFEPVTASFVFAALGVGCFLASPYLAAKVSQAIGWMVFGLSPIAYAVAMADGAWVWRTEAVYLSALIVAAIIGAWSMNRTVRSPEWVALGVCALVFPFFSRLAYVVFDLSPAEIGLYPALLIGWMTFSTALSLVGSRMRWANPMVVAWTSLVLALLFYVPMATMEPLARLQDISMVGALLLVTAVTAWSTHSCAKPDDRRSIALLAAILILPCYSRLAWVVFEGGEQWRGMVALILAWSLVVAVLSGMGAWRRWADLIGLAWVTLIVAMAVYPALAALGALTPVADMLLVSAVLAVTVAVTWATTRLDQTVGIDAIATWGAIVALPLFSRLSWLILSSWGLGTNTAIVIGWTAYALAASIAAWRFGWVWTSVVSWLCVVLAVAGYWLGVSQDGLSAATDGWVVLGVLAAVAVTGVASGRSVSDKTAVYAVSLPLCWAMFSRLVVVIATSPTFHMPLNGALTLAWSLFAIALMAAGFVFEIKALRYWSFAVFGATLGKVLMVDMASVDPAVRVLVLTVLGLGMLAVGYVYVKNREIVNLHR